MFICLFVDAFIYNYKHLTFKHIFAKVLFIVELFVVCGKIYCWWIIY